MLIKWLIRIKIKSQMGFLDGLITCVTGGIVMPRTVVIEGRRSD
ncbi:MAG: hypothetical protein R6X12_08445 [bacterium]